jgi:hypothetical protein
MTDVTDKTSVTTTEAALIELWRDLLGAESVGTTDDFFDLGGTSLTAIKFLQRIENSYGPDVLTPETLYEDRKLDRVARALDAALAAKSDR